MYHVFLYFHYVSFHISDACQMLVTSKLNGMRIFLPGIPTWYANPVPIPRRRKILSSFTRGIRTVRTLERRRYQSSSTTNIYIYIEVSPYIARYTQRSIISALHRILHSISSSTAQRTTYFPFFDPKYIPKIHENDRS